MVKKWGQRIYLAVIFLFCICRSSYSSCSLLTIQNHVSYGAVCLDRHRNACRDRHQCHEKKEPHHHARCHSDVRVLQGDLAGDQIRCIFRIPDGGYHVARRFFHHLFTKGAGVNTLSTMLYTELRKGGCARNCTPCQPFCFCLHFFCFLS